MGGQQGAAGQELLFRERCVPIDNRKHYMVMFFDNSTMNLSDQAKARDAAMKFLDSNTGANRYIAVVDFGGTLRISQNFTTDAARLKHVVRNLKFSAVAPTPSVASTAPSTGADHGHSTIGQCGSRFRRAHAAAGAAQSGERHRHRSRTQDAGPVLLRLSHGSGTPILWSASPN